MFGALKYNLSLLISKLTDEEEYIKTKGSEKFSWRNILSQKSMCKWKVDSLNYMQKNNERYCLVFLFGLFDNSIFTIL